MKGGQFSGGVVGSEGQCMVGPVCIYNLNPGPAIRRGIEEHVAKNREYNLQAGNTRAATMNANQLPSAQYHSWEKANMLFIIKNNHNINFIGEKNET